MNSKKRILNLITGKPVDRQPAMPIVFSRPSGDGEYPLW